MNLSFAENLKSLRRNRNITQERLAEALGVSSQSVSRWELSICYPDLELLPSIANFFGVTVDSLLLNDPSSKEKDYETFETKINELAYTTKERIEFVKRYCSKYPENDYYAYHLVSAITQYVVRNDGASYDLMTLLSNTAKRLLETQYRNDVIRCMVSACDESDIDKWLDLSPYSKFNRRFCLVSRALTKGDEVQGYVQQGLEMLETFAAQLDRRYPDSFGSERKLIYQRSILRVVESFGEGETIPDGWKLFYAYKQLVYSACLFNNGSTEDGWDNFDRAMEMCNEIFKLKDEWLDVGGELFSNIKVSKDWNYAVDTEGNEHKLFGIVSFSYYNMAYIYDLLVNPRWAWFNSVRETPRFIKAVEWVRSTQEEQQ